MTSGRTLFDVLASQRLFIYLTVAVLSVAGIWSAMRMPSAVYPELTFPRITIVAQGSSLGARQVVFSIIRPIAEYSTIVANSTDAKVAYLTSDHLGSPRITTDALGQVISRRDFMPFGEEITRTNYGADSVRQKFTGYERDNESDLDFAQARMYKPSHGRFTSVDPLLTTGRLFSPQTWNRYLYTLNNPLAFTDPTGMYECSGTEKECGKFAAGLQKANDLLTKIGNDKRYGTNSNEYKDAARALGAYGTLGDKNGVTVGFGKLGGNILGSAIGTMSGKNGTGANTVSVTIDLDKNKSGSDLLATIGHEGSHVADNQAYQGALISAYNGSDPVADTARVMAAGPGTESS